MPSPYCVNITSIPDNLSNFTSINPLSTSGCKNYFTEKKHRNSVAFTTAGFRRKLREVETQQRK